MKISCDLCGSELQMEAGGQSARCTVCGMVYSLERLREKMKIPPAEEPCRETVPTEKRQEELTGELSPSLGHSKEEPMDAIWKKVEERQPQPLSVRDCYNYPGPPEHYFEDLFATYFPQYRVMRDVSMVSPGEEGLPVSFLLLQGDRPVLAVLLCSKNEYDYKRVTNPMRACTRQRIPCQRYYREFRNDAAYVCDRVCRVVNR